MRNINSIFGNNQQTFIIATHFNNYNNNDNNKNQSSCGLVGKVLASHAGGRGFNPPRRPEFKNPVGWESDRSQSVCDAGSPCYEALASPR